MDFHKLLKLASKNQKNAEKELPQVKRYSTSLPPPKKAERPKVNPTAIKAIIGKKEKTKLQEASEKKKQAQVKQKDEKSKKEERKTKETEKSKEKFISKTDKKKKTLNISDYKSKDHENKHKHFMNMIDEGAERKQKRTECERKSKPETTKKNIQKPTKQPMNFKELMELAKRKQNGEVIIDKTTAKTENAEVQQQPSLANSSSKKHTNADAQKYESGKKVKKISDSKMSHDSAKVKFKNRHTKVLGSQEKGKVVKGTISNINTSKVPAIKGSDVSSGKANGLKKSAGCSAKIKLKNGHTKVLGSQEKGKVVKGTNSNMNTSKVPALKGSDVSSGKANGLKKSACCSASKDQATIHAGQAKPKLPPQQRTQVNRVPMKRTAPPPKLKAKRGRLCSEDEEDEDDDFIDDTGEDVDVSKYIRQIFGYDKRNYGYESEYALNNMEASYTQIMKEEARSARLGMTEDIEDMKKEKMEFARKKAKSKTTR